MELKFIFEAVSVAASLPPKTNYFDGTTSDKVHIIGNRCDGKVLYDAGIYCYKNNRWLRGGTGIKEVTHWLREITNMEK
jgi:hypothetical protein